MEAKPPHNKTILQLLVLGRRGQLSVKNSKTKIRLLGQAQNKTVFMVHLLYKVQGGVRKAGRLTMQEASRTSGFVRPRDPEQAPGCLQLAASAAPARLRRCISFAAASTERPLLDSFSLRGPGHHQPAPWTERQAGKALQPSTSFAVWREDERLGKGEEDSKGKSVFLPSCRCTS